MIVHWNDAPLKQSLAVAAALIRKLDCWLLENLSMGLVDISRAVLMAGACAEEMTSYVGLAEARTAHQLSGRSNTSSANDRNVQQRRLHSLNQQQQRQQQHQGQQQQQQTTVRPTQHQPIRQLQQQQQ